MSRVHRFSKLKLPGSGWTYCVMLFPISGGWQSCLMAGTAQPCLRAAAQSVARTLGLEVTAHEIRRAEDIAPVFDALKSQADALYIVENALISANDTAIATLAIAAQLPTILASRSTIEAGGLMCYGPNYPILFRRAAEIVDKILNGAKPGDIPVEQPTKFDLVINLKTAKALGLTFPDKVLALADEVIE